MDNWKRNKVVLGTVIYPFAMKYFMELIDCMKKQIDTEFDILMICDGVNCSELFIQERLMNRTELINCKWLLTPSELRIMLIEEAKRRGYELLVIVDSDDTISIDRIKDVCKVYDANPGAGFIYNKLVIMNGKELIPDMPREIVGQEMIIEKNFLGMSNTALCLKRISFEFLESLHDCKSFAFDWYLHSRMLIDGLIGIKALNCCTYYRIHENNCAGIQVGTDEEIDKEIEVKKMHFVSLKKYSKCYKKLAECYRFGKIIRTIQDENHYWWNLTKADL